MKTRSVVSVLGFVLLFAGSVQSFAVEEPKVDITSFVFTGQRTRTAELCGKVAPVVGDWMPVRIVADPNSGRPGMYHAFVGKDGRFCLVVSTFTGKARASVGWEPGKEAFSDEVSADQQNSR